MSDVIKCCANCEYWDCYNEEKIKNGMFADGECHRYPPSVPNLDETEKANADGLPVTMATLILVKNTPLLSHPFTYDEDWCGEFSALANPRVVAEDDEDE